jgi:hypothetical protein
MEKRERSNYEHEKFHQLEGDVRIANQDIQNYAISREWLE